ncbi:unannotated protein [freshwater metagenome]|uniref:2-C-methyl-D-erythritol 2,4-cyclodiphosphate synthase n=1 Tax=freshwater metagenome TaxID=449393 RepID=A0A6J7J0K3_9ZZZZ|nr:2-C-methyl-D-erythritol 2,4-cyclodiphosphate synthase [Actinomycetota bacterium]
MSGVRTGIGWDTHRLEAGRPLILGGVEIEHPEGLGLAGHSDADVLTHAVIDALLGAAGLDDIGTHFPDTDERWRGADSIALLEASVTLVRAAGFAVGNIDATVLLEIPKLGARKHEMRDRLAAACGIAHTQVNVKATTGERMGFVGRGEGIGALAIATISAA